jgi:RNA polymerase sigma-70 factor, ECF subfamily
VDEQTLTAWALRAREGDERGFRSLVDALTRTLIAMAYRYTGDWEWARDLTQETWIRVHQHLDRYDADRSFVTWLYAVHRNGCLDHARRAWVRHEAPMDAARVARLAGAASDDPSAEAERGEFRERVLAAATHLSRSQRAVFVGVDVDQRDQAGVARELGMEPGNLRTTLHFARKRMARILRSTDREEP